MVRLSAGGARALAALADKEVVWHDVECGSYEADLPLWRDVAAERAGPILDVGCGTGRVALDLARRGFSVTALDSSPALARELARRARSLGLHLPMEVADARTFDLRRTFALVIAPMQVFQLLGGAGGRAAALARARSHLAPGGRLAAALADPLEGLGPGDVLPPVPDMREANGWAFSSTPIAVRAEPGGIAVDRLRQAVSPAGDLHESVATIRLDSVTAPELELEASMLGFRAREARRVPETEGYVSSTIVVLEAV